MKDIEELLRRLFSADGECQHDVLDQIMGASPDQVGLLIPYLGHQDAVVCSIAVKVLGWLAIGAGEDLPHRQRVLAAVEKMAETANGFVVLHAAQAMLYLDGRRDLVVS